MLYSLDMQKLPNCKRFGRMMQKNHWSRLGYARKNVNLLVLVINGSATFEIDGLRTLLVEGDVILIPAGTSYRVDTEDHCEYYFYHFDGDLSPVDTIADRTRVEQDFSFDVPEVKNKIIFMRNKTSLGSEYNNACRYAVNCSKYRASAAFSDRLALDLEMSRMLLLLSRIYEQGTFEDRYPLVLEKMLSYIGINLKEPISTMQLCQHCGVSASYAARLFKKYLHTTVSQYITDQKLAYAAELLANTRMNITQIAEYLGFCDVFYFSRRFKQKYGKSPTQMF